MGCCFLATLLFGMPRLMLFFMWLQNYLSVFETSVWPFLGFVFMPWTTAAYAYCLHNGGVFTGSYQILLIVAVIVDVAGSGGAMRKSE